MQNKTPRGTGKRDSSPDRELEQYGVWVKAEPFDVVEEPETGYELIEGSPEIDIASPPESLLSEEEERSLMDTGAPSVDNLPELSIDEELPSFEEEPSVAADAMTADDGLPVFDLDETVIDIPLDDLDFSARAEPESIPAPRPVKAAARSSGSEIESMDISLDEFGISDDIESKTSPDNASKNAGKAATGKVSKEIEHVDLSDFGLGEESAHHGSGDGETDDDIDLEPVDIDLEFDDTIPTSDDGSSVESVFDFNGLDSLEDTVEGFDELLSGGASSQADVPGDFSVEEVSLDAEDVTDAFSGDRTPPPNAAKKLGAMSMSSPKNESYVMEVPESTDVGFSSAINFDEMSLDGKRKHTQKTASFDDVRAVERDLGSQAGALSDKSSSSLLNQIARELAGIKEELVSLKSQLKALKVAPGAEPGESPSESSAQAKGGFFDEEEDDTIALTGDELDNILNTADFTEGSAGEDITDLDSRETLGDILPESGNYASSRPQVDSGEEPGIEIINLEDEEPLELESEMLLHEEISLPDDDVVPFTKAPPDTSYLDDTESVDVDRLLADVPLVEPDLSDITIDLDENIFGDSAVEELPLCLDEEPELSIEEPLPEIEEFAESLLSPERTEDLILDIDSVPSLEEPDLSIDSLPLGTFADDTFLEEELPELDEMLSTENDSGGILLHQERSEPKAVPPVFEEEEIIELGDADLDLESEKLTDDIDSFTIKASQPVQTHPDDLSLSLDDSFFVEDSPTSKVGEAALGDLIVDAEPSLPKKAPPPSTPSPAKPSAPSPAKPPATAREGAKAPVQEKLKSDVKSVLLYLDQLLSSLPDEKIEEFASSEYYDTYKKLFDELGLL